MNPLAIAAVIAMAHQMGQSSRQQKLALANRANPYYMGARQAPIWNLADIGLMLYGLKKPTGTPPAAPSKLRATIR